ncbi:conjugal transfer protein TraD (plasmid) [Xanthobacter dioxanivorans]|uniref:Conjugal transfer protein TraD n=2 Tax=Xanthobacter dioxanivorans TaxID=2528964 RepID=A0A974PUK1_9HYPH|nr:conjugal transfer protein TraD [Xanthobacter dioxanivorans]QRG09990.1 conjugal transfer protein TraD [Xanthobacter dioxanivorans]
MRRSSSSDARKRDTREKIELGGLIVKRDCATRSARCCSGLLIDGQRAPSEDEAERTRLSAIGAQAFGRDHE